MRNVSKCRAPYCKASAAEYVKLVTKKRVFFIHVGVGGTSSDRDVRVLFLGRGGGGQRGGGLSRS